MLSEEESQKIISDLLLQRERLSSHIEDLEMLITMMADQLDGPQYEPFAEAIENLLDKGDDL